jgi:hypothetical protein
MAELHAPGERSEALSCDLKSVLISIEGDQECLGVFTEKRAGVSSHPDGDIEEVFRGCRREEENLSREHRLVPARRRREGRVHIRSQTPRAASRLVR